ncbi:aspartate--tRNA ligase [Patescibacteria group bacterium]|nr:aspartate--tRNA ligase [Patescibacteria group bacterium]
MYRTHNLNQLGASNKGEKVVLSGWVNRRRDHGGVIFIDLRDRYGLTQIVSDPVEFKEAHDVLDMARSEYVLRIEGTVRLRPEGQANANLTTGEIEVLVQSVEVLNASKTPPFEIDQDKDVSEDLRLKYRYLDLRRNRLKSNIVLRYEIIKMIREHMDQDGFIEVETPILIKGTPEGSREYLVPSRIYPGTFYVLPQSPQQLKQLLMIAGFDKYFQIARCFRDEDQRGDRQPEFTQLDVEMSFIEEKDIMKLNEDLMMKLVGNFAKDKKIKTSPFPVLTYHEAMNKYGSDSPDLRFDLEFFDINDVAKNCEFGVFKNVLAGGGVVKGLKVDGGGKFTRRELDELEESAKIYGAKGLANIIVQGDEYKSPIAKFFKKEELDKIKEIAGAKDGDLLLFCADSFDTACESLGKVRLELGKKLGLIDEDEFAFCWIVDFPMFEKNEETGAVSAVHHPFTAPKNPEDLESNPENCLAKAYDLVLNGTEVGGGSIRIHSPEVQKKVFSLLNISDEDAEHRFGHMLEAFDYGAPPHGGIAWGLDRLVMLFAKEPNIREVIAFPKDQKAKDLMLGAPSQMPDEQVEELSIKVIREEE